ncbi:MAG TPA: CDGSH iron-sulfur domain-containing protein [Acidimicrobiales bacterium]|nr:CDGSH iron-sulfur domain-containing protein [Acidimicrobiales bacterium]
MVVEAYLPQLLVRLERLESTIASATQSGGDNDLDLALDRLRRSVIRPLRAALGHDPTDAEQWSSADGGQSTDSGSGAQPEPRLGARMMSLAREATRLRAMRGAPAELLEATAALQDLARRFTTSDGQDDSAAMRELAELQASIPSGILAETNGPYLVTNVDNLTDWLGCPLATTPQMALCRCGQSRIRPLCDGTHAEIGFTSEKDPNRVADHLDTYVGQQVTILDNRGTCQHSGFCTDRLATAFRLGEEPFVNPSGGRMDEIIRAVRDCPSGALSYAIDRVEAREQVDYHGHRQPTIEVTKDGPYRVRGGLPLTDGEGNAEPRNQGASLEHYALCRCGHSQNKPFCSGMHWYVEFHDPVPDRDRTPTMFEWCGGLPVLTRMTRLFYEKYVPEDPMLAPLFANMSADHPQRVATWLAEVFGGPSRYSEDYGGYPRMLSQHIGRGLTEEWRQRWVELLMRSAREAGLPNDAEFASAFQSYIQWGSRLAVENSQTNAHPPKHMPMPHWDWDTGAGAPGTRISALAPAGDEDGPPVVLPAADEPVRFEKHIKPLFRPRDRQSMQFVFDLWSYDDVRHHAQAILERVRVGTMPCDGAWPPEMVEAFERWTVTGMSR